jgi:hypothetical protein
MSGWYPESVLRKDSDTGTTYKLDHNGQEIRVRVRSDRQQIEFWAASSGCSVSRVQIDKIGAGVHVVPREAGQ